MAAPQGYTSLGVIGFSDHGTYDNSATYYINDLVHYLGNIYRCKVDGTSGIAPAENVNWTVFVGTPTNIVEELIAPVEVNPSENAYTAGRQFIYNDQLYEVVKAIAVGDSLVNISDDPSGNIKDADRVETQVLQTRKMIAPIEENPTINAYSVGDQLIYNGLLYNVTAAIAIGDALAVGTNISLSDAVVDQIKAINTTLGNTDISGVGASVTAAISSLNNDLANISNTNLLDNPWFTINQRGQINYTSATASGHTVDRWKIYDDMELSVDSNGVSIASPTHDTNFHQFIESYGEEFADKSLTLSILLQNGQLVSGTITLTSIPSTYQPIEIYNNNGLYGGIIVGGTTHVQIYIGVKSGTTLALRAAKFELSTVSTLAMDTAPNYAVELLKCQRYFHIYATQSLRPANMYDCIPQMRDTPTQSTITIGGTTYYANSADI